MGLKLIFWILSCMLVGSAMPQDIESNSRRERNFAFEVKQIDEFLERFNNESDAFLVRYLRQEYPGVSVERRSLIKNMFNLQDRNANGFEIDQFLDQVTDHKQPVYLDFNSGNWYAQAFSKFQYNGALIDVVLVLRIAQTPNGASKWMIVSAYSKQLTPVLGQIPNLQKPGGKFLDPMSHATNFIALSRTFKDRANIHDYLDPAFFSSPSSRAFLKALLQRRLDYRYVRKVRYHFLDVKGWIFTISHFERASVNSGWLVSRLHKASDQEKETYRRILFRN